LSRHGAARQALNELATAKERKYLDEEADVEAAAGYYAAIDPDAEAPALFAALSTLLQESHGVRPGYSPAVELYPWIDLQPDGKLRSVYTEEEFDPEQMIEEAAEIEGQRTSFRLARGAERGTADDRLARNRAGERVRAPSQRGHLREAGQPQSAHRPSGLGRSDRVSGRALAGKLFPILARPACRWPARRIK
jgi:hypothetical protein